MTLRNTLFACFLSAALAAGVAANRPARPTEQAALSQYQRAQLQTVLVITSNSQGSAVVIKRENSRGKTRWFAWTAAHVVEDQQLVLIRVFLRHEGHMAGYTTYAAKVLGRSAEVDIALLQIDAGPSAFQAAIFASDEPAQPGDPIFAVGNFKGAAFENSISTGVIANIGVKPSPDWPWPVCDQTTAPVYPGSSGCGVFNGRGEVLGLVVGGFDATLNVFVPVRAISHFAELSGFAWAVRGNYCPADAALN